MLLLRVWGVPDSIIELIIFVEKAPPEGVNQHSVLVLPKALSTTSFHYGLTKCYSGSSMIRKTAPPSIP